MWMSRFSLISIFEIYKIWHIRDDGIARWLTQVLEVFLSTTKQGNKYQTAVLTVSGRTPQSWGGMQGCTEQGHSLAYKGTELHNAFLPYIPEVIPKARGIAQ